jgi:hypothetical protein
MGAHIGLNEGGAADRDHLLNRPLQFGPSVNALDQRAPGRRLLIDAAHDDHPMSGKSRAFGERTGAGQVRNDRVAKIRR